MKLLWSYQVDLRDKIMGNSWANGNRKKETLRVILEKQISREKKKKSRIVEWHKENERKSVWDSVRESESVCEEETCKPE